MRSRMFPDPTRSPLTGPVRLPTIPADGPAHWHPQYDEPVYAATYHDHRDQLLAGLREGRLGEVTSC